MNQIREHDTEKRESKKALVVLTYLVIIFAVGFFILLFTGGYIDKALIKLGIKKDQGLAYQFDQNIGASWDRCLNQLGVDADVVFFGDSITYYSDFTAFFPEKTICNFGIGWDTLAEMKKRVNMVKTVQPEKVFLLGGINSLRNDSLETTFIEYKALLDSLCEVTDAEIYAISVLPISKEKAKEVRSNETITEFNSMIEKYAVEKGIVYIDLASVFLLDGAMNPAYSTDGVHLSQEGYELWAEAIADCMK